MKKRILILIETSRIYGRQIIDGIVRYSLENGNWILFLEDRGLKKEDSHWLLQLKYDGIIARTIDAASRTFLDSFKVPLVEMLGDGKSRTSDVLCDGKLLGNMAAQHFFSMQLRNFAFFSTGYTWWSADFCENYRRCIEEHGFSCDVSPFSKKKSDASLPLLIRNGIETKIAEWLRALPKPVGVFCPSDSQAVYLVNLCQILEIAVPNEIAILGVENNATLCNATSPPLSSISVDGFEAGYQAAILLDKKINKKPLPKLPILIPPLDIVPRASTDSVAVADPDVAKALYFISQNDISRISVKDIADSVDLSHRTLIRRFHEVLGHSPESEIQRIRIERVKTLLRDTDLSVTKIAENLGYSSTEYLVRAFYKTMKMTPRRYREKIGLDNNK